MPNTFAYIALLGWPLVAIYLFSTKSLERAIVWSVLGSFLFLPSKFEIDFVGLPPLDKVSIPNLVLFAAVFLTSHSKVRILPHSNVAKMILLSMVVGAFFTASNNQDQIWIGTQALPGMKPYDAVSSIGHQLIAIIPFLIGCQFLATVRSHRIILQAFLMAGLVYSILALFEIRMSPQLHTWVYGYFPHTFSQTIRGDGFRPVVFLTHGLWLAFFVFATTLAAAALWRDSSEPVVSNNQTRRSTTRRPFYLLATGYLSVVLILCKSLGSALFAAFSIPFVLLAKPQTHLRIAVLLAAIAVTYPILRGADLVPVSKVADLVYPFSTQRAESLLTRMKNEDLLLTRAGERPIFGWGSWGRNRVYDEFTGKDISITDGYWIISIGSFGWVGYLSSVGLLAFPIIAVWRRVPKQGSQSIPIATSALCLLLGINLMELLPNATLSPWTWLISGALLGYSRERDTDVGAHLEENYGNRLKGKCAQQIGVRDANKIVLGHKGDGHSHPLVTDAISPRDGTNR